MGIRLHCHTKTRRYDRIVHCRRLQMGYIVLLEFMVYKAGLGIRRRSQHLIPFCIGLKINFTFVS